MTDYNEIWLQSMDILINKKIESIRFDETINAVIINADRAEYGEYTVSTGAASFKVYSNDAKYVLNDKVMVTIPQGNYDNTKFIIGKQPSKENQNKPLSYVSPMTQIIDLTGNLIDGEHFKGLIANSNEEEVELWHAENLNYLGYDRLGLQAQFRTYLSDLNTSSGNYGLAAIIDFDTGNENTDFSKRIELDSSNFFGDPYNFDAYYTQMEVFNIKLFNESFPIKKISIVAYQKNNFLDYYTNRVEEQEFDNIFIKDPFICLGKDTATFDGDSLHISSDNLKYQKTEEEQQRTIEMYWIHRDEESGKIKVVEPEDGFLSDYSIQWYQYKTNAENEDNLAGANWDQLSEEKNKLSITVNLDSTLRNHRFKVLIIQNSDKSVLISSNILEFLNIDEVGDSATLKNINELELVFDDAQNGNYFLYNKTGRLYSNEEVNKEHRLIPYFTQRGEDPTKKFELNVSDCQEIIWQVGATQRWVLKEDNTFKEEIYDENNWRALAENEQNNQRLMINSFIPIISNDKTYFNYKINSFLINSRNQNMVKLIIFRDNQYYTAFANMTFDYMGTSGSDYTVQINWNDVAADLQKQESESIDDNTLPQNPCLIGNIEVINQYNDKIDLTNKIITASWKFGINNINNSNQDFIYEEEDKSLYYPVWTSLNNGFQPLQDGNNDFYYFTEKNVNNFIDGNYYYYDIENKNFKKILTKVEAESNIIYKKSNPGEDHFKKFSFVQANDKDAIESMYENENNYHKFFIFDGENYIVDPYEEFFEAEIYYEPQLNNRIKITSKGLEFKVEKQGEEAKIYIYQPENQPVNINSYYVLEISIEGITTYPLVTYESIPLRNVDNIIIEGASKIRYSTDGNIDYDKNPYVCYLNGIEQNNGIWIYQQYGNTQFSSFDISLQETIKESNLEEGFLKPILVPPSIYTKETALTIVQFKNEDNILWTQPIFLYQDNYPSSTLNKWDGKEITTDNDTGTILAQGFAAGRKEYDNTFTGVVLGDWSKTDSDTPITKQTGVYGFNHGAMSYALKDDGTAFLGKDGRGRIYFDGNNAVIKSASWRFNKLEGMMIDLDDGILDTRNQNGQVYISPKNDRLLDVKANNTSLLYVSNDDYYLQTENFNSTSHSGTKINLKNGRINSYNLDLQAFGQSQNFGTETRIQRIRINSGASSYPLRIGWAPISGSALKENFAVTWEGKLIASDADISGKINAGEGNIAGWQINEDNLLKTSGNYQIKISSETKDATNTDGMGNVFEIKNGSKYPFAVKANGSIIATSGEIGGWRISPGMGLERTISVSDSPDGKKYDVVVRSNPWGYNSQTNSFSPNEDNSNFGNGYAFAVYKSDSPLFYVNYKGLLYAKNADISGKITATSGTIGGINISNSTLSASTSGGSSFTLNSSGYLQASGASISGSVNIYGGSITINKNGSENFKVTSSGDLTAHSATIYGTINANTYKMKNSNNTYTQFYIQPLKVLTNITFHNDGRIKSIDTATVNFISTGSVSFSYSGGGGGCFIAGTKILMANGSYKNIEDIKENDLIISYDEINNKFVIDKVIKLLIHHNTSQLMTLILKDGTKIKSTLSHPFLTTNGWKTIDLNMAFKEHSILCQKIKIGDILVGQNHNSKITDILYENCPINYDTYNIFVKKYHTYIANNYIVHNAVVIAKN